MTTTQVSAPAALAVSLDDAAASLRLEADELADVTPLLSLTIGAITQEAEHQVQRAFISRPMRVTLDRFPVIGGLPGAIRLDGAPVASIESISYRDEAGQMQTLDPQDYEADKVSSPGWAMIGYGKAWPATQDRANAVTVDYTAGYGADHTSVPECARQYILLRLADLWDPASRKFGETVASAWAERLLDPLRVF